MLTGLEMMAHSGFVACLQGRGSIKEVKADMQRHELLSKIIIYKRKNH